MKTVKEFYDFFEAIPEEKWTKLHYSLSEKCCALGHLGCRVVVPFTIDQMNLQNIFYRYFRPIIIISDVNDHGPHASPKQNILEALQVCAELGAL